MILVTHNLIISLMLMKNSLEQNLRVGAVNNETKL